MTVTSQFVAQSLSLTGVTIGIGAQTRTCVGSGPHPLTNAGFPAGFALRASSFGDEWTARQAFAHLIGARRRRAACGDVHGCIRDHGPAAGGRRGAAVAGAEPELEKSQSGVWHGQDSVYSERRKSFTSFESMESCLAAGGRARDARGADG